MKYLITLIFVTFFNSLTFAGAFTIKGKIENGHQKTIYLDEFPINTQKSILIDSFPIDEKGNYFLQGEDIKEETFYRVRLTDKNWVILLIHSKDKITLDGKCDDFATIHTIKGSEDSKKIQSFLNRIRQDNRQVETWNKMFKTLKKGHPKFDSTQKATSKAYQEMMKKQKTYKMNFVSENGTSAVAAYAVNFFDPKKDFAFMNKTLKLFQAEKPNSKYTKSLEKGLQPYISMARLQEGGEAPEINLKDPDGNLVALSSLRGKYVLIDFWASWCGPCRRENPNVVKIYNKYKNQGFEVYSISLDKDAKRWKQAIDADNLTWIHVSELKGWNGKVNKLYQVTSIPRTFLLDKEGKIIAKNLRGPALEKKIASLFGE